MIFHAHVDLLLGQYDILDWGAWESKVKKCVPLEKQEHLLVYFVPADFELMEQMMRKCMRLFKEDAKAACEKKGIVYPAHIPDLVMDYFDCRLSGGEW
jgi:hypothetical protein